MNSLPIQSIIFAPELPPFLRLDPAWFCYLLFRLLSILPIVSHQIAPPQLSNDVGKYPRDTITRRL